MVRFRLPARAPFTLGVALNEGLRRKKALWRPAGRKELESITLAPWASRRRQDLLDLVDQLTSKIQELSRALEEEVEKRPVTRRLMTHPGVGPLTALVFELGIGTPDRFHCGKQIASYVGLVPSEESSGDRRRLGHISKQGKSRFPWDVAQKMMEYAVAQRVKEGIDLGRTHFIAYMRSSSQNPSLVRVVGTSAADLRQRIVLRRNPATIETPERIECGKLLRTRRGRYVTGTSSVARERNYELVEMDSTSKQAGANCSTPSVAGLPSCNRIEAN